MNSATQGYRSLAKLQLTCTLIADSARIAIGKADKRQIFFEEFLRMKKEYRVSEVGTTSKVARMLGVGATTLTAAIAAGHVATVQLGCGHRVVVLQSAKEWHASERKPGPKRPAAVS